MKKICSGNKHISLSVDTNYQRIKSNNNEMFEELIGKYEINSYYNITHFLIKSQT